MTLKSLGISTVMMLSLGACSQPPFEVIENLDVNRAETGAVIGGLIGGVIGASSDDNTLIKTVVGAGIGAAAGGVVGDLLDRQAEDLRREINNENVAIENTGSELKVTLPQALLFASDSAVLTPALEADLRALANNLTAYPDSSVQIVGHTDDTGTERYNLDLSQRRAASVAWVLESGGVSRSRITSTGAGETQPVAANTSELGKAQNRRVEVIIRPTAA